MIESRVTALGHALILLAGVALVVSDAFRDEFAARYLVLLTVIAMLIVASLVGIKQATDALRHVCCGPLKSMAAGLSKRPGFGDHALQVDSSVDRGIVRYRPWLPI